MPTLKEELYLKKLYLLFLLTAVCFLISGIAAADFWPNGLPSIGKIANNSSTLSKSHKFDTPLQKTPAINGKYDPWPQTPPQIGTLILKQEYWNYMKEAAQKYHLSPYLIQAVCAIESRYISTATSGHGQCYGLMQLHRDTARKYGVDAHNPRENIMGGAAVLAHLLTKFNGDLSRVLHVYNATCTTAYEREVKKAFSQAMRSGIASLPNLASKHY
jgi:soluble lytic murein transglycosylase-like protein